MGKVKNHYHDEIERNAGEDTWFEDGIEADMAGASAWDLGGSD